VIDSIGFASKEKRNDHTNLGYRDICVYAKDLVSRLRSPQTYSITNFEETRILRHGISSRYELQFDLACDVGLDYAPRQFSSRISY
jgi:hypothetical protein